MFLVGNKAAARLQRHTATLQRLLISHRESERYEEEEEEEKKTTKKKKGKKLPGATDSLFFFRL